MSMPKITLYAEQNHISKSTWILCKVQLLGCVETSITRCSRCLDGHHTLWQKQMEQFLEEGMPAEYSTLFRIVTSF